MNTTMTPKQIAGYMRKKLKMNQYIAYKVSSTQKGVSVKYQIITSDNDLKPYSSKYVLETAQFVAKKHGFLLTKTNNKPEEWNTITLTKHEEEK